MDTRQKISKYGGSLFVLVPPLYAQHIGIREGDYIVLRDDEKKKGKFISFWKDNDQTPSESEKPKLKPEEELVIEKHA